MRNALFAALLFLSLVLGSLLVWAIIAWDRDTTPPLPSPGVYALPSPSIPSNPTVTPVPFGTTRWRLTFLGKDFQPSSYPSQETRGQVFLTSPLPFLSWKDAEGKAKRLYFFENVGAVFAEQIE